MGFNDIGLYDAVLMRTNSSNGKVIFTLLFFKKRKNSTFAAEN